MRARKLGKARPIDRGSIPSEDSRFANTRRVNRGTLPSQCWRKLIKSERNKEEKVRRRAERRGLRGDIEIREKSLRCRRGRVLELSLLAADESSIVMYPSIIISEIIFLIDLAQHCQCTPYAFVNPPAERHRVMVGERDNARRVIEADVRPGRSS
jgi:hypothetical protein